MSTVNISYIKPRGSILAASKKAAIVNAILDKVKAFEGVGNLKLENELLVFVCNCIENLVIDKSIDKKSVVLEIYDQLFGALTPIEKALLSSSIDFMCNNSLIQKVPVFKKYTTIIQKYLKTKL